MMGTEGLPEPYTARRRPLYLIEGALDSDRPLQAQALTGYIKPCTTESPSVAHQRVLSDSKYPTYRCATF
jgi:hypothetical protein